MKNTSRLRWSSRLLTVLVALVLVPQGAGAALAAEPPPPPPPTYYLALGDSLARGVQPDGGGVNRPTEQGYADQLHARLSATSPRLSLVKLGCPVLETARRMIDGGYCSYEAGSQLAQAERFLQTRGQHTALVTLDIGANDFLACQQVPVETRQACLRAVFAAVAEVAHRLRAAAGPQTRVVAMTYYNPLLAHWFLSPAAAQAAASAAHASNAALAATYTAAGLDVADVEGAFHSADFTSVDGLPRNVRTVCALTYMCTPFRNIHANAGGYGLIADTFASTLSRRP